MSNSVVRHATSPDPLRVPFTPHEVVWPVWSTEPDVVRAPTGEYVAFFTSKIPTPSTLHRPCTNCSRGNSTFDILTGEGGCGAGCGTTIPRVNNKPFSGGAAMDVEPTVMSWSDSPWGPWSAPVEIPRLMPGFESCPKYGIDENFAAVVLEGGRLVALGRGCMTVHVTTASDWKDPSTYEAPTGWRIDDSNGSWWGEDPFIWRDSKGRFHSLTHAGDGSHLAENPPNWGCGRHWFSRNGTNWHHAPLHYGGCAYSPTTHFSDGGSYRFGRSERPHLVFAADGTTPIALVVAVTAENVSWGSGGAHDASHTFLQPIRTKTDDQVLAGEPHRVGDAAPSRIPVDGITEVVVEVSDPSFWSNLSTPACRLSLLPTGPTPSCRLPTTGPAGAISFDRPSPTGYTAPARRINGTHLACTPPAVPLEGVAVLSIAPDNATWTGVPNCLQFFALFSASVSRRPFFGEAEGALLVSTDATLAGDPTLRVSAVLSSPQSTLVASVPIKGGTRHRLPFDLLSLPPRVSTTVTVRLTIGSANRTLCKTRQFERVAGTAEHSSSAVDLETGALMVDGERFLIAGVYISTNNMLYGNSLVNMTPSEHQPGFAAQLNQLARTGVNTAMIYQASQLPPAELSALLDVLTVIGMRITLEVTEMVTPLLFPGGNSSANWGKFAAVVHAVRDSPALLGYYICVSRHDIAAIWVAFFSRPPRSLWTG